MTQEILLGVVFAVALFFLGRRVYRSFTGRKKPGCEKCGSATLHQ